MSLTVAVLAAVLPQQREVWRIDGRKHIERFGDAIALLPDRTGDGVPELLVGAPPSLGFESSYDRGVVRVLSGGDLSVLLDLGGEPFRERKKGERDGFGSAVAAAGDVDGDGIEDFLVGEPNGATVELLAGVDGHRLMSYAGAAASQFGSSLADLGDVDGDGRRDFAVGAPEERGPTTRRGVVTVVSGATGATLHRAETRRDRTGMGTRDRIAALHDVDGDGARDLALLDRETVGASIVSVVRIHSGATGALLFESRFDHHALVNYSLVSVAPFGDLDQDGTPDLVVGGLPADNSKACAAFVVSGDDGNGLLRVDGDAHSSWIAVGRAGDLDGDGLDELLVGCDGSSRLRLFRGSDGAPLQEIVETIGREFGRAFVGGVDFDGDGSPDVAVGFPDLPDPAFPSANGYPSGAVDTWSWSTATRLGRRRGLLVLRLFSGDALSIDDIDGDGCTDVVHAVVPPLGGALHPSIEVRSGRDGALLAEYPVLNGRLTALAAAPDLDGDARSDYAIVVVDAPTLGVVELRSSASGALLRTCVAPPNGSYGYDYYGGGPVAFGVDAGGVLQLAVASPYADPSYSGLVDFFDGTTGAHRFRIAGESALDLVRCGQALAFLGDVDGDGTGDWMIGTPGDSTNGPWRGRATLVSGVDGATIADLLGSGDWEELGASAAAIGDQDGDGVGDVAIGAPGAGPNYEGEVRLVSGRTWTTFATIGGPAGWYSFGYLVFAPGDVNRDGLQDWAAARHDFDSVHAALDLHSGETGTLLSRLSIGAHFAPLQQRGSATGDRIHDVFDSLGDPADAYTGGVLRLLEMAELFLDVEPSVAQQGDFVVATTRGGIPSLPTALELVAMNGVAVGALIDLSAFDAVGEMAVSDVIPPGLAGNLLELRAWAVDARGKLSASGVATLSLQ